MKQKLLMRFIPFFFNYITLISVCAAKSSALSIGFSNVSTVRKAARLAVYEAVMIMANRNQAAERNLHKYYKLRHRG